LLWWQDQAGNTNKSAVLLRVLPRNGWISPGQVKVCSSGEIPLLPAYVATATELLGKLDGVRLAPNNLLASEQDITQNGNVYLAIQNIFRTEYFDYAALLKE